MRPLRRHEPCRERFRARFVRFLEAGRRPGMFAMLAVFANTPKRFREDRRQTRRDYGSHGFRCAGARAGWNEDGGRMGFRPPLIVVRHDIGLPRRADPGAGRLPRYLLATSKLVGPVIST